MATVSLGVSCPTCWRILRQYLRLCWWKQTAALCQPLGKVEPQSSTEHAWLWLSFETRSHEGLAALSSWYNWRWPRTSGPPASSSDSWDYKNFPVIYPLCAVLGRGPRTSRLLGQPSPTCAAATAPGICIYHLIIFVCLSKKWSPKLKVRGLEMRVQRKWQW